MLIHPWDASTDLDEATAFLRRQGFGQLIAAGRGRDVPVVVPTQFTLADPDPDPGADPGAGDFPEVLLHLARPNPIWSAIEENPLVVLAVAGDWSYIPSSWKAVGDDDPALGVPTTYYAAVQVVAEARVLDDPDAKRDVLRRQLDDLQPGGGHADPAAHERRLPGIRGLRLIPREVRAKFKFGGNVDAEHRAAVAERLADRAAPGDAAARAHLLRRGATG